MRNLIIAAAFLIAAVSAGAQMTNAECLACHDNPDLKEHVDGKKLAASVHGPLDCTNCHADVKAYPHDPAPKAVDCASCHPDSVAAWDNSLHA